MNKYEWKCNTKGREQTDLFENREVAKAEWPKSADCCAVYKRSNGPHRRQGAVSGGSRINRLKYQTILQSQSTYKVPNPSNRPANPRENAYGSFNSGGNVNAVNGEMPVSLYRNTGPTYKRNLGGFCGNTVKPPALISTGACRMKGTLCCFKWENWNEKPLHI